MYFNLGQKGKILYKYFQRKLKKEKGKGNRKVSKTTHARPVPGGNSYHGLTLAMGYPASTQSPIDISSNNPLTYSLFFFLVICISLFDFFFVRYY